MISGDIERIRSIVGEYMDFYDFRIMPDHLEFYFTIPDENKFGDNFNALRLRLKKENLVPFVQRKGGENILIIIRTRKRKYSSVYLNVILLILTIVSTIWVGMGYYSSYYGPHGMWGDIWGGFLYFSLPLMTIIGCHEMGHYFAAKRHKVAASLPFFIPAPTMLGTLGAFISMRDPIPDRKALVDIGISGPIVGFIVAIPVTILGLILGNSMMPSINPQATNAYVVLHVPLIYQFLAYFIPSSEFIHPVAMAGWVGFVVTAINLFPVGQLDGGHVARALLGDRAKYVSYGFAALLIALGFFYLGWLIFAFLVIFLGLRHPPPLNDIIKLDKKRVALAVSGFLLLAVTFVPIPVEYTHLQENVEMNVSVDSHILVENLQNFTYLTIEISNKGEMSENITLRIWGDFLIERSNSTFSLGKGNSTLIHEKIWYLSPGEKVLNVELSTLTHITVKRSVILNCFSHSYEFYFEPSVVHTYVFNTTLHNLGSARTLKLVSLQNVSFNITNFEGKVVQLPENSSQNLSFVVTGPTVILALDYSTYEAAWIEVRI